MGGIKVIYPEYYKEYACNLADDMIFMRVSLFSPKKVHYIAKKFIFSLSCLSTLTSTSHCLYRFLGGKKTSHF